MCAVDQCAEEERRVPESLFPFSYNPKMSLNLSQVPNNTQRSPPLTRTQLRSMDNEAADDAVSREGFWGFGIFLL